MPSATPKGFPFPIGTDRLMDGDDAIAALAQKIDSAVGVHASGAVSVPVTSGTSQGTVAVTFPAGRFTAAPIVNTTNQGTNVGWFLTSASSITTAGCTVMVAHRDGTNSGSTTSFTVGWHAHQA